MMRKLFVLLLVFSFTQLVKAQEENQFHPPAILSDSATISLLTSTPWDGAIYALFGHTAIRINDSVAGFDYVFNYGIFSFNSPNFMFRFVKGETDYMVGLSRYDYYLEEYKDRGVAIIEQVFNLTQKEKQSIYLALMVNAMPENRVYRYNYFYDNCSTRPRDIIAKYIDGKIEYDPTTKQQTYRDLVHGCVKKEPWARFGIDLVIGSDADKIITDRQKDFLPLYLLHAYKKAVIENLDGTERELVGKENVLLVAKESFITLQTPLNYPLLAGCILLLLAITMSFLSYKRSRFSLFCKIADTLLYLLAGLSGCIIFFLMFFSEHPCVSANWNIVWLNPLQLIAAFLFFLKSYPKCLIYYHFINFVALLLFLLAWCLIPQQLEIAFIPYILTIALRSAMNILEQKKNEKKADFSLPKTK